MYDSSMLRCDEYPAERTASMEAREKARSRKCEPSNRDAIGIMTRKNVDGDRVCVGNRE